MNDKITILNTPILSNPKCGWCTFTLGNFIGTPSYITDVPIDVLNAILNYQQDSVCAIVFDEEGSDFTMVIQPYTTYIINNHTETENLYAIDINADIIIQSLINEIENHCNEWADWMVIAATDDEYQRELEIQLAIITTKLDEIKKHITSMKDIDKLNNEYQKIKWKSNEKVIPRERKNTSHSTQVSKKINNDDKER